MASVLDKLKGRLALVTGASSGIGLEFCRTLAAHGCRLIMVSNEADKLMECASNISEQTGVEAIALYSDLTRADATGKILDFLDSKGLEPDILINNAGIFSFKPIIETPLGKIEAFLDLHVRTVTELSRAFAQRMVSRGAGNILNMSSMSCWMPMPGLAMYASTKAYIRVFSRSLHYELRDSGVRVTVACPGGIATSLFGLPKNLLKLAVNIGAVQTPEKFTERALRAMLRGKMQYINGFLNRIAILFVGILPTPVRMLIKHKMLDKNITR